MSNCVYLLGYGILLIGWLIYDNVLSKQLTDKTRQIHKLRFDIDQLRFEFDSFVECMNIDQKESED